MARATKKIHSKIQSDLQAEAKREQARMEKKASFKTKKSWTKGDHRKSTVLNTSNAVVVV